MVIVPARDEGPRIAAVVRSVAAALPGVEIVVIENGSTDDTADRARLAGATVLHSEVGYARALRVGFVHAHASHAPWVVTVDGDGQHPAEALAALLRGLDDADLVVGSRFLEDAGYPVPAGRRLAIGALSAWASLFGGQALTDVTSGLRAMRPAVVAAFALDYPTDVADANVLVRALRAGWRVVEVPVAMRPRLSGSSQHQSPSKSALFALRMAQLCVREGLSHPGRAPRLPTPQPPAGR